MKKHQKLYAYLTGGIVLLIVFIVIGLYWHHTSHANGELPNGRTASFIIAPVSGSYSVGSTFTVSVSEHSSAPVNAVQLDLKYDTSQLSIKKVTFGSGAILPFSLCPINSAVSGTLTIACAIPDKSVTGTKPVAQVSFVVLTTGQSKLSFAPSSAIIRTSDRQNVWNRLSAGAAYDL